MDRLYRRLAVTLLLFSFISFSTQKTSVSWCVVSEAEEQKCLDLAGSATARNIRGTLLCVRGQSPTDCMEKIKNGTADAAAMFADDIYTAGWCFGLELAAGESYNGLDGISYYVVALARRSSSDMSLLEMHERSSCHPGICTTVGWTVPIGFLVNTSQISVDEQCNFPKGETCVCVGGGVLCCVAQTLCVLLVSLCVPPAAGDFFGYSCVPGVKGHWCVAENLGDVAFVKHTTISDNMDGNNMESWAMDLELEDLKLLCPDGSEAGPFDHETCHLAVVPAKAVVVRLEDKCRVWKYLERLQNVFGNTTMFSSVGYIQSDLLFSDSTHHLLRVVGSYTSWLVPTYTTVLQAFECESKRVEREKETQCGFILSCLVFLPTGLC
uniref:otolith matrix protein 1-like n=1 Tax=Oncorhynchus gorbuscha TaxID=8017 RepID=UPI001EAF4D27|nr:otolith matrix protein 1-like [Oncorhynchus gorbuscha]